jgi:hypothetical protein
MAKEIMVALIVDGERRHWRYFNLLDLEENPIQELLALVSWCWGAIREARREHGC